MFLFMSLMILLPDVVCHIPATASCVLGNPNLLKHNYYHRGDLIIAGIISQFYMISDAVNFRRHPSEELVDDLMYIAIKRNI